VQIYSELRLAKRLGGLPFAGLAHAKGGLRVCAYANQPQKSGTGTSEEVPYGTFSGSFSKG
jgi:hypothetical protein